MKMESVEVISEGRDYKVLHSRQHWLNEDLKINITSWSVLVIKVGPNGSVETPLAIWEDDILQWINSEALYRDKMPLVDKIDKELSRIKKGYNH